MALRLLSSSWQLSKLQVQLWNYLWNLLALYKKFVKHISVRRKITDLDVLRVLILKVIYVIRSSHTQSLMMKNCALFPQIMNANFCWTRFTGRFTRRDAIWAIAPSTLAASVGRSWARRNAFAKPTENGQIPSHFARKEVIALQAKPPLFYV